MATDYRHARREADFDRYKAQWESGMMAAAIGEMASLDTFERAALLQSWFQDSFNGASFGVYHPDDVLAGKIEWVQAGPTQFDCLYTGPFGVKCALGRVYEQPNGTWASMVIAGVKDDMPEAMAAAEWALAKLCA